MTMATKALSLAVFRGRRQQRFSRRVLVVAFTALLSSCATPPDVKQALKQQSEAYGDLENTVREFRSQYVTLNEQLFRLNHDAKLRLEALSMARALAGDFNKLQGYAKNNVDDIKPISATMDSTPSDKKALMDAYKDSLKMLENAYAHGLTTAKVEEKKQRDALKETTSAMENVLKEIKGLTVMHEASAEYLNIDLSPDSKLLKEAITNIRALRGESSATE